MATIVLGVVGGTIGGMFGVPQLGYALGAIAGSLLDTYVLQPEIFGTGSDIRGPRLDDMSVQSASEGSPMRWVMAPQNRTAGTVFWLGPLIEVPVEHEQGKGGGQTTTTYAYSRSLAIHLSDCWHTPINRITKIFANGKLIWDINAEDTEILAEDEHSMEIAGNARFSELTIYKGTSTQPIDPLMEAIDGAGSHPRYKKSAYIVIKDLQWDDYGNMLPNITALVEERQEMSVADTIEEILTRASFTSTEWDVSRVPGCMRGYVVTGIQDAGSVLDNVTVPYALSFQESDGKLRFFARGKEIIETIPTEHLAAHSEGGSSYTRLVKMHDCDFSKLPKVVNFGYIDPDADLQSASQPSQRINIASKVEVTANVPITFKSTEGKQIAYRMAWVAEAECTSVEVSLPPNYIYLEEGDVLQFEIANDRVLKIRTDEITRGNDYRIEIKGVLTQPHLYSDITMNAAGGAGGQGVYTPPDVVLLMLDLPALQEAQLSKSGIYYAVCALDPEAEWRGARLYMSSDGTTFTDVNAAPSESSIGTCRTRLLNGPTTIWDEGNSLEVELYQGSLASATEDECLAGKNWASVGLVGRRELIAFREAEQLSEFRWRISKFLRGLRNTERYTAVHDHGDEFILLGSAATRFHDLPIATIGAQRHFKAPPLGAVVTAVESQEVTVNGSTLRPFGPCDLEGERNVPSAGDVTVSWVRRSRTFSMALSQSGGPLLSDEVPETYEIDFIRGGSGLGIVVRTKTVVEDTSVVYTAAQISADGFSAGAPIRVRVYQVSNLVGRGNPAEMVVV